MPLFNVGFVIFPDLTRLDFTGPQQVLPGCRIRPRISWQEQRLRCRATVGWVWFRRTRSTCPQLDLICVPGGNAGVVQALINNDTIEFVRQQATAAKYVTSVCTGAFILGVAGILKGRRATTHWAFTELLPLVGATPEKARVVKDGNVARTPQ